MSLRCLARRSCNIFFARSSVRRRDADRFFPARLMKYCIMRMPEPMPLGLTRLLAMVRAIDAALRLKVSFGGNVDRS